MTPEPKELEHTDQPALEGDTSWWTKVQNQKWPLVVLLLGIGALAVWSGELPNIPSWTGLVLFSYLASFVVAWTPAVKIVEGFIPLGKVVLVRAEPFAEWELTPEEFAELEVSDGELYQKQSTLVPVYEVDDYDEETNVAEGTWRASATDLELLEYDTKIDEVRGRLETMAREGLSIRVKQLSIVRDAVGRITDEIVTQFESETIPDGEAIDRAVREATDRAIDTDDDGKETDQSLVEDDTESSTNDDPQVSVIDDAQEAVATDGGDNV